MFGPKRYELALNRGYVAHWGMKEGVREFIQNALDSESPFEYEFIPQESTNDEGNRWMLKLRSEFTTLPASTLLLGKTSKRDATDTIGSFGEGYKIAMLVLTREGYPVELHNGNLRWRPSFQHSRSFDDEVLVVEETELEFKNKGLTVLVRGLTDEERMSVCDICLKMQEHIGKVRETKWGRVLFERGEHLYVGSLFICNTKFRYGYDIKPEFIKLERDRQTVSDWDLAVIALDMLIEALGYEEVAKLIIDQAPDVSYARWIMPQILKEEVYKQWKKNNANKLVAESQEEMRNLVAQGFKVVHVSPAVYHAVTGSAEYKHDVPNMKTEPPQEMLRKWFAKHSQCLDADATKDWAQIILAARFWEVK